jgi:hypothetical protein
MQRVAENFAAQMAYIVSWLPSRRPQTLAGFWPFFPHCHRPRRVKTHFSHQNGVRLRIILFNLK